MIINVFIHSVRLATKLIQLQGHLINEIIIFLWRWMIFTQYINSKHVVLFVNSLFHFTITCFVCQLNCLFHKSCLRKIWGYQRGNQNPQFKERQTTQWSKEKDKRTNNDLQNITRKTKDLSSTNTTKNGDELRCSGKVDNFCSTSGTHRITLVTFDVCWFFASFLFWTVSVFHRNNTISRNWSEISYLYDESTQ